MIWILDASVAVKWFFADELQREAALAVRENLAANPTIFAVPHLFMSEMIHVLTRKSGNDTEFVSAACNLLLRLGMRTIGLSATGWRASARWCAQGLSGYDATYVALAQELAGSWVTADGEAVKRSGQFAVCLEDWRPTKS